MKYIVITVLFTVICFSSCDRRPEQKDVVLDHNTMDHSKMDHGKGHTMESSAGAENAPYELQFIDTMIDHHQGAIDMALLVATRASHDELKTLAKDIIEDQRKEIAQMRQWRSQWFGDAPPAVNMKMPGMTEGMQGMDLKKLDSLKGNEFDVEFVRQMIPHHEGAVTMAKALLEQTQRPEMMGLAGNVIKAQTDEIARMRSWEAAWSK